MNGNSRTVERLGIAISVLLLLGWSAWWVTQVIDVIELLQLAYGWGDD